MTEFNNPFEKLEIDPIEGTRLMNALGVYGSDLSQLDKFTKVKEIMSLLKGRPDAEYLISKIGKGPDKLDTLFQYSRIRKDYESKTRELENLRKELSLYE